MSVIPGRGVGVRRQNIEVSARFGKKKMRKREVLLKLALGLEAALELRVLLSWVRILLRQTLALLMLRAST